MDYESLLDAALALRINPEKTRRFDPAQFESGLASLQQNPMLKTLSRPEIDISIVGTNGKGSTSFLLAQLFGPGGPVGLYTSPHLRRVLERIRIGLCEVDARTAWQAYQTVCEISTRADSENSGVAGETAHTGTDGLTYFEILTLMSGLLFSNQNLPVRIYEAGLGGRLDATRIFKTRFAVLTNISLDHTELLGTTPLAILREKLGILTEQTEMVMCMPQVYLSNEEIVLEAKKLQPGVRIEIFDERLTSAESYIDYNIRFAQFCFQKIQTLTGRTQTAGAISKIPGRLEQFHIQDRTFVFDPAHNPDALRVALQSLEALPGFPGKDQALVVFGILPDRNLDQCLASIKSSGFCRVFQVTGGPFRTEKTGLNSVSFDALEQILPDLTAWNVFLGSHKLYDSFLDLLRGIQKLETNASTR